MGDYFGSFPGVNSRSSPAPVPTGGYVHNMSNAGEPRLLRYQVVKDAVLGMISDQGLRPGDRLPSTVELAGLTGVSQISVRRALDELERAGRIQRHQGVGTFVAEPRIVSDPTRSGALLKTLGGSTTGREMTTELLGMRVGLPGESIAAALHIDAGQPVWEVTRRRLMGGMPAILERAVLPLQRVPALDENFLREGGSLYQYISERYGIHDADEEQYLEVCLPSTREREWLALPAREQVVSIKGVSFDAAGVAFDCYQQVYPARRFGFYFSGSRDRKVMSAQAAADWSVETLPGPG